jgi:hypothetical protein
MSEKKNIYLVIHKNFVKEEIPFTDPKTGEAKTFNAVTLPKDTILNGLDLSYYKFNPLFVNQSRYSGENYRDIPLLRDKEVWLTKDVMDAEDNYVYDENGRNVRDTVKVMPEDLKRALDDARSRYLEEHTPTRDTRSLSERAASARGASAAKGRSDVSHDQMMR